MTTRLRDTLPTPEEEERIFFLETILLNLPLEGELDYELFTAREQDFLASLRGQQERGKDFSLNQEEWLLDIWKKYQEQKP